MAEQELVSASWIQWLGGGIAFLYMTLLGLQQRRINKIEDKMVTHEEMDAAEERYEDKFDARREAVEQRIADMDKRMDRMETRLTDEIRNSENRLLVAFTKNHRG